MRVETITGTNYIPAAPPPAKAPEAPEPASQDPRATRSDAATVNLLPARSTPSPSVARPLSAQAEEEPGEIQWSNKSAAPPSATGGGAASRDAAPLNPAGQTMELAVPLRDGKFYLGDIATRIAPNNAVSVQKERLVQIVTPLLRTAALDTLKALPDSEGNLPLAAIKDKGFNLQFDQAKVEMQFTPSIEQRATGKVRAGGDREQVRSENLAAPATVAAFVNMRAGADYSSQPFADDDGVASARVAFDGALRWADVVFESAATFDMEDGFSRGASRFVYDRPDSALRFSAGDMNPLKTDLQGGSDILGLSIEKSYQKLQPAANIRPTGSRSFRIERPSKVDVMVNGHVVQRLHLRPGDYDLSDLPLSAGANDVSLVIEDDVGQRRTLEFSVFSGRSLLAPGISEWALSAGVASRYGSTSLPGLRSFYSDLAYDFSAPVVTGFYERGLTPDLTGNIHLQADPDTMMGGAGAAFQTSFGFWGVDAAASQSLAHGLGYAGSIGYDLANIEGKDGVQRSVRLAADYRSEKFAAVNALDPRNDTILDLSASYSQELPWDVSGSVSGTYALGRGLYADRYGMDVSLSRRFGPALSAGISAGFEQTLGEVHYDEPDDGFTAALRLSYRINNKSSIDAGHDMSSSRSQVAYRHQEGSGVGSWNAQVEMDRSAAAASTEADAYGLNGSMSYIANRADLAVSQHTGLAGLDTQKLSQRTTVTAGTAIAFADGGFAAGRPVSNGFAIIGTHDNLPDSDVAIGSSQEARQAASDIFGPALVSDISPYSPARVSYDVNNLPDGYDLGAGAFDLYPGYKSGYKLTVGSEYTVTALGSLVDSEGAPVLLLTGTAFEEAREDGRNVKIFTNSAGRFGAQGLRSGRWVLEMATEPKTRFIIDIPKNTAGLVRLGTLSPVSAAE